MARPKKDRPSLSFHPLTAERWAEFETLFGPNGACGGCWCMWWRLPRSRFAAQKGEGNRRALRSLVDGGEVPGIMAYQGSRPVGWCSVAPRDSFPSLDRSRVLARVDGEDVWSIVCLFVARGFRRSGVSRYLITAACEFARSLGATVVEGYPVEPRKDAIPDVFAFMGLPHAFEACGFVEVARRSPTRPIMRKALRR